ncbi:MAG TPA: substrate-binding domain-containing protein [Conexibacter sp.]
MERNAHDTRGTRPDGGSTPSRMAAVAASWRRAVATAATLALVVMAIAACGSSDDGGSTSAGTTAGDSSSGSAGGTIIEVNCPVTICGQMKTGSEAAAKAFGVDFRWTSPTDVSNFVNDYVTLIRQAISQRPDALIVGEYVPAAARLIRQARAAGIAVFVIDTGLDTWRRNGALGFSGYSYPLIGESAGAEMVRLGVQHFLCINPAAQNPNLDVECNSAGEEVEASGGTYSKMYIPLSDQSNQRAVAQNIQGYLASHPDVDGIFTASGAIDSAIVDAAKAAGKPDIPIGGASIYKNALKHIKAGEMAFAVDLGGYLEGYYAVQMAAQYLQYHLLPGSEVITGGQIVNKENVDAFLEIDAKSPGVVSLG